MSPAAADRSGPLKLLIWTVIPTHYMSAFFAAIRGLGVDLVVHYFGRITSDRVSLGWSEPDALPPGERYVPASLAALEKCPDWRERTHILPGYDMPFLVLLPLRLSVSRVTWLHWSEGSRRSLKSRLSYPLKWYYGALVNRFAIGALAIGDSAARTFMSWGVKPTKIRFLPYAAPAPPAAPTQTDRARSREAVHFLFLGALCHRKAIDVLLRAFRSVVAAHRDARLELVGHDGSNGEYQRLAGELGIAHAVQFTMAVAPQQVGAALARCDVFVLPSRYDGWGVVLNEAAALGKPLISTDACGAAHHLIVAGRNGFRVPAADDQALAGAMLEYCGNPALLESHGRESQLLFREFTPERNARRLLEALDSLAAAPMPYPGAAVGG
jgi:glycosyltransferase involved in cell wall biosynthesis